MMKRCITCGTQVNRNKAHISIKFEEQTYLACCPLCQAEFERNPDKYVPRAEKRHK